jgi:hypothetical protein
MEHPEQSGGLRRQIGLWSAIAIVIGTTIGSGIFRSPAGIADKLPGPLPLAAIWVTGGLCAAPSVSRSSDPSIRGPAASTPS